MNTSGIYSITSPSGKKYIGSAVNIRSRWRGHLCDLRKRRHHSPALQRVFDKYGEQSLQFDVVEFCDPAALLEREQLHMDALPKTLKYNICKVAGNRSGMLHTEESKRKMSATRTGVKLTGERLEAHVARLRARSTTPEHAERARKRQTGVKLSAETRAKISQARKGQSPSEDTRVKISAASKGVPRPRTAEHSAKIGAAKRGVPLSTEHRRKLSIAGKGKTRSPEARQKAADATSAKKNTSGFRGVSFAKNLGRWYAYANVAGKMKNLGHHDTPEQAAAYRAAYLQSSSE